MRKWLMATLFALITGQVSAQDMLMRDVFRQMPDSIMPYLSQNNRLDFIDFLDSDMKAEVKNALGGTREMKLAQPIDSMTQIVVKIETFLVDSIYGESRVNYYSTEWKPLAFEPELTEVQRKRIDNHRLQNIVKKDDEVLNKR